MTNQFLTPPSSAPNPTPAAPTNLSKRVIDLWVGGDNGYDESQFYTGGARVGKEGNTEMISARIRPTLLDAISAIVKDPALNVVYGSTSDFIRDALAHRMMWLRRNAGSAELRALLARKIEEERLELKTEELDALGDELERAEDDLRERVELLARHSGWPTIMEHLQSQYDKWEAIHETYNVGEDLLRTIMALKAKYKPNYDEWLRTSAEIHNTRHVLADRIGQDL